MCRACWEEAGSPRVVNEKTRAAAKLIADLYEVHSVGGMLHIVVDDFNIEQEHVDWCMAQQPLDDVERACGAMLQGMTCEERASALAIYEGWVE